MSKTPALILLTIMFMTSCAQATPVVWHNFDLNSQVSFEYPNDWSCTLSQTSSGATCAVKENSFNIFQLWLVSGSFPVNQATFNQLITESGIDPSTTSGNTEQIVIGGQPAFRQCFSPKNEAESTSMKLPYCLILAGQNTTVAITYPKVYVDGSGNLSDSGPLMQDILSRITFVSSAETTSGQTGQLPGTTERSPVTPSTGSPTQSTSTGTGANPMQEEKGPPLMKGINITGNQFSYGNSTKEEVTMQSLGIPTKIEESDDRGAIVRITEFASFEKKDDTLIMVYKATYPTYNLTSEIKFKLLPARAILEETFQQRWYIKYEYSKEHSEIYRIPGLISIFAYSNDTQKYDRLLVKYTLAEIKLNKLIYRDQSGNELTINPNYFEPIPEQY